MKPRLILPTLLIDKGGRKANDKKDLKPHLGFYRRKTNKINQEDEREETAEDGICFSELDALYHENDDIRHYQDIKIFMEFPFVSLSKNSKKTIFFESQDKKKYIKLTPGENEFVASIYDFDLIIFFVSQIHEGFLKNKARLRTLEIKEKKLIKFVHRHMGGKTHKEIAAALNRLAKTKIETNVLKKKGSEIGIFLIEKWSFHHHLDGVYIKVTLSEWLMGILSQKNNLLTIKTDYFKLTSPMERIIYRLARIFIGKKNKKMSIDLAYVHSVSGSQQDFKKFKYEMKKNLQEIREQSGICHVLEYGVDFVEEDGKPSLVLSNFIKTLFENSKFF